MAISQSKPLRKKRAIVTGGSAKDAFAMGTLAVNLQKTNPGLFDEMIVFHDGISRKDQRVFSKIMPTRFIYYQFPEKKVKFSSIVRNFFTPMVFCKYECLKLLQEYDQVVWLDYDILILGDISFLTAHSASGIKFIDSKISIKGNFLDSIEQLNLNEYDLKQSSVCAGIIVFENKLNFDELYKFCIINTIKYAQHLFLPEQAIFELMLQKFHITPELIAQAQVPHPLREKELDLAVAYPIKILHCYSHPKFWNGLPSDKWNQFYQQWQDLGGSRYGFHMLNLLKKIIRKLKDVI